jgi:hypothetical protein
MRMKFIVEVPCTVVDRYFIFAESEEDARRKMAGSMSEVSKKNPNGEYVYDGSVEVEAETNWDKAVIVGDEELGEQTV